MLKDMRLDVQAMHTFAHGLTMVWFFQPSSGVPPICCGLYAIDRRAACLLTMCSWSAREIYPTAIDALLISSRL